MKFYTTNELAKMIGVSRITIFRRIKEGKIRAERIGRNYVITEDEARRLAPPPPEDQDQKARELSAAVKKVVREYGETLKKLGSE